jgi:hypothetical protein
VSVRSIDLHLFRPFKKQVADTLLKQKPMWSTPSYFGYRTVEADVFRSGIQALASRWDKCLHVTSKYVQSDVRFGLLM